MADTKTQFQDITILDWPEPLGANPPAEEVEERRKRLLASNWWLNVARKVLPRIARKLEKRFGAGIAPEQATGSAVRVFLNKFTDLQFESVNKIGGWLYRTAWRKARDQLKREHYDLRKPREIAEGAEVPEQAYDNAASAGYQKACEELSKLREVASEDEKVVLDGLLDGKTHQQIADSQGWHRNKVEAIWRRIKRKAR
jgi:hypothetical protein